jgi:nitrous oxide reductase
VRFLLFDERFSVKEQLPTVVHRRDLLRATMTAAAAAAAVRTVALETAAAKPRTTADKRRARYQPNSKEVQEFYHVNRYPTR